MRAGRWWHLTRMNWRDYFSTANYYTKPLEWFLELISVSINQRALPSILDAYISATIGQGTSPFRIHVQNRYLTKEPACDSLLVACSVWYSGPDIQRSAWWTCVFRWLLRRYDWLIPRKYMWYKISHRWFAEWTHDHTGKCLFCLNYQNMHTDATIPRRSVLSSRECSSTHALQGTPYCRHIRVLALSVSAAMRKIETLSCNRTNQSVMTAAYSNSIDI